MLTTNPSCIRRTRLLRVSLLILGVPQLVVGGWAVLDPVSWHAQVGPPMGPFNEHLAQDVGAALGALGALLIGAAAHVRLGTLRLALGSWLVFAFPHALYHSFHFHGGLSGALNVAGIVFYVVLPGLLLFGLSDGQYLRRTEDTAS